jgi:hypothetical protein
MAGTRNYVRGSNGRFAGAGSPGAKVTTGRAGGFANANFRTQVIQKRAASQQRKALTRRGVKAAVQVGVTVGVYKAVKGRAKGPVKDAMSEMRAVKEVAGSFISSRRK